ncbi:MAG: hypothetical protein HOO96_10375 [Polyangiaceae bacterium]|nr:hypothetical protein [Polyangiaceae bacterium]
MADRLLRGERFQPSENDYDWLGRGIYFWEYGPDRALRFAQEQKELGKIAEPSVVGAIISLGNCFDLMDTRATEELGVCADMFRAGYQAKSAPLPVNGGKAPDHKLRRLDCALVNFYLDQLDQGSTPYDSVRGAFHEGDPVLDGSKIFRETHIQLVVRRPGCIRGVFRPY